MTAAASGRRPGPPKVLAPGAAEELAVLHQLAAEVGAPCVVGDVVPSAAWLSEDPDDKRRAARACRSCPLLELCTSWGRRHRPTGGVWGRYSFSPRGTAAAGWHDAMGTTSKRKTTPKPNQPERTER